MIDTRFIEAKRRAAKYSPSLSDANIRSGDVQHQTTGHRGRRRPHRNTENKQPENEDLEFSRDAVPLMNKTLFTAPSPQVQPVRPTAATLPQQQPQHQPKSDNRTNKVSNPVESLEHATANLSLRDGDQPPKQGRQRGRNRRRSNVSKTSLPFHNRTPSGEQRAPNKPPQIQQSRVEVKKDAPKGILPISIPAQSPNVANTVPIVRLPEAPAVAHHPPRPPASDVSHDTSHLIRSSDTDFGSDISRGAVQGGRLYDHRHDKSSPKLRHAQKFDPHPTEEKPQQPRGVLLIQPGKVDQTKESGRRGGLLKIDTNKLKPNNTKPNKSKGQQNADYNRNATPLRKEDGRKRIWNPDDPDDDPVMLHERPRVEVTPEYILREVKSAYQEIQNLERKVRAAYEDEDDLPRNIPWQSPEENKWPSLARMHREYHSTFNSV